jgi:aconitate hydratase
VDAVYDERIEMNLNELEPLIAEPHSPGNVKSVKEIEGFKVDQVCIGSCTNSSLKDLKGVASILKGNTIDKNTVLTISAGSRQVVEHMIHSGEMIDLLQSGARILENTCGPCIGMGLAPKSNAVSLRTFNRNFLGRSGTKSAQTYLVSPETAAVSAISGKLTDPRSFGSLPEIKMPVKFFVNDNMIIPPLPPEKAKDVKIVRGPNIKPLPEFHPLPDKLSGDVLLKVEDDITTDHIMPAGAKILPLRSNIPEISKFVFNVLDETFPERSLEKGGGFIIGGENYGQGSSREHAAIAPKYLGIKAVIVKSFARIHLANLVNFGIVPLTFVNKNDYNNIDQGDKFEIDLTTINSGKIILRNLSKNSELSLTHSLNDTELEILKTGGKLTYIKHKQAN